VGEVLASYAREIGPTLAGAETLAYCIKPLAAFFGGLTCDGVKGSTCRAYARERAEPQIREYVGRKGKRWTRSVAAGSAKVRRELGVLQRALNYAVAEGRLIYAPKVTLPKVGDGRDRWLTRDEVARLLRSSAPHLRRFILIALATGRRASAILALRWTPSLSSGWVDLDTGVIHFRGAAELETSKKRGSVRMTRGLEAHMHRWVREGGSHVVMWREKKVAEIDTALAAACRRAGLEGVSPHILKHTSVTWALQRGMSLEDAEGWFDTSAATLSRFYRSHSPHHQARAKAIMEGK
jgi:integrase